MDLERERPECDGDPAQPGWRNSLLRNGARSEQLGEGRFDVAIDRDRIGDGQSTGNDRNDCWNSERVGDGECHDTLCNVSKLGRCSPSSSVDGNSVSSFVLGSGVTWNANTDGPLTNSLQWITDFSRLGDEVSDRTLSERFDSLTVTNDHLDCDDSTRNSYIKTCTDDCDLFNDRALYCVKRNIERGSTNCDKKSTSDYNIDNYSVKLREDFKIFKETFENHDVVSSDVETRIDSIVSRDCDTTRINKPENNLNEPGKSEDNSEFSVVPLTESVSDPENINKEKSSGLSSIESELSATSTPKKTLQDNSDSKVIYYFIFLFKISQ